MMNKRTFKDKIYGELAKITKAMANPHRIEIIDLLAQGSYTVEKIAAQTGMSIANTSQHLQTLKNARLVSAFRKGVFIYYHLIDNKVFEAWCALRELGIEGNAEIHRLMYDYRKKHHSLEAVSMQTLLKKIEQDEIVLLDVRPEEEYKRGHIHRAISIPVEQLSNRVQELSERKPIVVYCRGPFCIFADEAVDLLQKKNYQAVRMDKGYPDWEARGFPVEKSQD